MLTVRQRDILNIIVEDYIQEAVPIASEMVARKHKLGLSSATIRNEVANLEHEGYITRPHSSAGSVPVDKGYRTYVETVETMRIDTIPVEIRDSVRRKFVQVESDIDEWTSVAAAVLAGLVGNMAIVTLPKSPETRLRHIELIPLQEFLILQIVIFEQASMRRQIIRTREPKLPEELQVSANKLNDLLVGLTRREIETQDLPLSSMEKDLVDTTVVMLKAEDHSDNMGHYVDGLRNLLGQPEFAEKDKVHALVASIEDGRFANAILDKAPESNSVKVVIGQESQEDMLWPLSIVLGQYGSSGEATGIVCTIGPVRMEYTKAMQSVELLTDIMNNLSEKVYSQ